MVNASVKFELMLQVLIDGESYASRLESGKGEARGLCSEDCSERCSGSGRRMLRAASDVCSETWSQYV